MLAQAVSAVALILLAASGASKLLDPDPTRGALRGASLPSNRLLVLLLGGLEIAAGLGGLAAGGLWLAPAAILYLGFALFTLAAVRGRFPLQSCGCFGRDDTPPTLIHVIYNGFAALALGYVAAVNQTPVPWSQSVGRVVMFLAFALVGAYLSYLLLAQLPRTLQQVRPG